MIISCLVYQLIVAALNDKPDWKFYFLSKLLTSASISVSIYQYITVFQKL